MMMGFIQVSKNAISLENKALSEHLTKSRDELMQRVTAMMATDPQAARLELAAYAGILAFFMGSAISRCTGGNNLEEVTQAYLQIIADHAVDEYRKVKARMPVLHEGTETKQ